MSTSKENSLFSRFYGVALLVFVNIVWVAASEITRYLFIDLDFKRPLFFTYAKSCMLSLFLSCYCFDCRKNTPESESTTSKNGKAFYSRLTENENSNSSAKETDEEDDDILDCNTLTEAEFEPISITDVESNTGDLSAPESQNSQTTLEQRKCEIEENTSSKLLIKPKKRRRRVRFNKIREVRRWPESLSEAATLARLPYNKAKEVAKSDFCSKFCGSLKLDPNSNMFIYCVYFAPLWLISSVSYQTALAYSSVSTVNLISASSPLFVLIFGAFFGKYSVDSFSWLKLIMVLLNMLGVCIVSRFSGNLFTTSLSLFSAFSNALYLFALARLSFKGRDVNMPLLLGTVGLFALFACTPLIYIAHISGYESQLPLPTFKQMFVLIANAFLGTLFADSIWLYATLITGSLTSSLSGSLGVPLSMLADSFFRNQPPNIWQIVASIPIMISFIGASILTSKVPEA